METEPPLQCFEILGMLGEFREYPHFDRAQERFCGPEARSHLQNVAGIEWIHKFPLAVNVNCVNCVWILTRFKIRGGRGELSTTIAILRLAHAPADVAKRRCRNDLATRQSIHPPRSSTLRRR